MTAPDIRVGDLVKATSKARPEEYTVYRVTSVGKNWVDGAIRIADRNAHVFEVLDRPLPPISAELLSGAVEEYIRAATAAHPSFYPNPLKTSYYEATVTAVINYLRQNDTHLKENSK